MLKGISFEDRIEVPSSRQITDAGQMIVPCAFARTGSQQYTAGSLQLKGVAADKVLTVFRDEADVFDEASLASFRSCPVTIGHPVGRMVTADNAAELQVGVLEGMPTRDEDTLTGTLVIARQDAIDLIEDGTQELSAGYRCDLEIVIDEDGVETYHQRRIKANHIAIVKRGRAGASCRIADEAEMEIESKEEVPVVDEAVEVEAVAVVEDEAKPDEALAPEPAESAEAEVEDEKHEEEVLVVDATVELTDALAAASATVATLTDELEASKAVAVALQDQLDTAVEGRCAVILVAKDLTDMDDFSGKSDHQIKVEVLASKLPHLSLEGRDEAYVAARFDVLTEDAETMETPMGALLRDNAESSHVVVKPSTLVADARAASIARNRKR